VALSQVSLQVESAAIADDPDAQPPRDLHSKPFVPNAIAYRHRDFDGQIDGPLASSVSRSLRLTRDVVIDIPGAACAKRVQQWRRIKASRYSHSDSESAGVSGTSCDSG